MLRKTYFRVFHCFFLRESLFWLKREVLCEYPQKCFKKTEMHSLAVIGSFWREKQHLLIFVFFYWFDQKQLFKQIQILIFSNLLRQTNFLSISLLLLRLSLFGLQREVLCEFPKNCFKRTEKHSLAVYSSLCGEKQFLLIFIHFTGLIKQIQFSSGFDSFQTC